jgi:hypothetical protein
MRAQAPAASVPIVVARLPERGVPHIVVHLRQVRHKQDRHRRAVRAGFCDRLVQDRLGEGSLKTLTLVEVDAKHGFRPFSDRSPPGRRIDVASRIAIIEFCVRSRKMGPTRETCVGSVKRHRYKQKKARRDSVGLFSRILPAATYSPTQFPVQYHRRYQA